MENIKNKKRLVLADLALFLVAIIWGGGFIVIKDSLSIITPLFLMAIRFGLAAVVVGLVFHKRLKRISRTDMTSGGVVGVFLFLAFAVQTIGLQYTDASTQAFLTATNVVFVPFISFFWLKTKPDVNSVVGSVLTLIGIGFITLSNGFSMGLGDSLSLLGAVFFALHFISIGYFAPEMDTVVLSFVQIAVAAVAMTIVAFVFEPLPSALPLKFWMGIGYQVIFATVGCLLIQNAAQKYTTTTHASIIVSLEAVFATIFGILLLGENLTLNKVIGFTCVFAAILLIESNIELFGSKSNKDTAHSDVLE